MLSILRSLCYYINRIFGVGSEILSEAEKYIEKHWDDTKRLERTGNDRLIGMPYEYFVPSIKGMFREMYYWDTYFASKGLLLCGKESLVKSSAEDMFYLVDKFGYMPNGSHMGIISRSQPPFLCMIVKDIYSVYKDKVWLKRSLRNP